LRGADPNRNTNVTLLPPFNGTTTAFTMYQGSTSYLFDPIDERQIVVSLGGVIQQPGVAYTVGTGSSIFFSSAPGAGVSCFITALFSNTVGVPTDAVFINKEVFNPAGIQTTFTIASGYTGTNIDIYRNGIRLVNGSDYTATNGTTVDLATPANDSDVVEAVAYRTYIPPYFGNVKIGVGGTDLLVEGNARVTGVLSVGQGTITLNGNTDTLTTPNLNITGVSTLSSAIVGSAVTITSGGIVAGLGTVNSINATHINATGVGTFTGAIVGSAVTITAGGIVAGLGTITNFRATHINISGITTVAAGSTAAPSITPTGDSDTGIFFPAADTIAFGEGGVEAARIDSSGRFGLGTKTPGRRFVIAGDTNTVCAVQGAIDGTSSVFLGDTDDESIGAFTYNHFSNHLEIKVNASERARIDSSGKIGIGTNTSINDRVTIVDSMAKVPSSIGWGLVVSDSNTDGVFGRGGAIAFGARRTDGGQFNAAAISGAKSNNSGLNENGDLVLYSSVASSLTERMRIVTDGNVGIGITNPSYKLHVSGGNIAASGYVQGAGAIIGDTVGSTYAIFGSNSISKPILITRDASPTGNDLVINTSGSVGVGTTNPTAKLEVVGNIKVSAGSSISAGDTFIKSVAGDLYIQNNTSDDILLMTTGTPGLGGNVGIASTIPTFKLDILATSATQGLRVSSRNDWGDITNFMVDFDADRRSGGDGNVLRVKGGASRTDTEIFDVNNRDGNKFRVRGDGAVIVAGSLSKGSGTFTIDHPLEHLSRTHNLVHSFVEGPRADLIYRGEVRLVSGIATIVMDETVGLTTGTWELLCREPDVFVTNNEDWTPVKAEITSTGVLTIQAQDDTCTAKVNWLVIAERHDKHMYDTGWTDENGKPILEPRKREKDIVGIAST